MYIILNIYNIQTFFRIILSGTASPEEERDETILSSESEPQVSERAADYGDSPIFGSPTEALRRVQFQIGKYSDSIPVLACIIRVTVHYVNKFGCV